MICHTVQNGGYYMFLILCFLWLPLTSSIQENIYTIQEFCSGNLYIHNIEPGEPYKLTLKTEISSASVDKWHRKSKRKCFQEFKTSDSAAHFEVSISNMSIPSCEKCKCNHFEIVTVSGHSRRYCGESEEQYFYSKSDKLSILFHHSSSEHFNVTLTFVIQRNVYIITGTPRDNSDSGTYIETPYFPTPYPPSYRAEYILQSDDMHSHVVLLFLDFQISHQSFIEVTGNNSTHPTRFYGNTFRPPVIVSQSNCLTVKFVSNDEQANMPGFRAILSFIKNIDSLVVPHTDCSSSRDGRGGYINVKTHEEFALYDCVWHIMPFTPFTKSNRSVSTVLQDIGPKSSLVFRSGHHSKSDIIKEINCSVQNCSALNFETIVPASENLYIRFSGYLNTHSVVNISYSIYHMGNCSGNEFKCEDGRCLLSDFRCDGFKQCPNGTDEELCPSPSIFEDNVPLPPSILPGKSNDNLGYSHYNMVLLIGIFGVFLVFIALFISVYLYCKRKGSTAPLLTQQTLGEMAGVPSSYSVSVYDDGDSPPSYEDFIKASDCYPPILYTRAKQRLAQSDVCTHRTTSFCTSGRIRHHSADSINPRSNVNNGDIFLNVTGDDLEPPPPMQSSSSCNVEIIQNNPAFKAAKNLKRSYSLDSKLNELVNPDSCHFLLSIVHPVSDCFSQPPNVHCRTLPSNFKIKALKNSIKTSRPFWLPDLDINIPKDRRFSWSFVPHNALRSELLTVVKTRCFSDPCNGISVHCSLY